MKKLKKLMYPPIIQQYLKIKKPYKNMILLYRMGDFYEFFFEDAIKVSNILNIALTKRSYSNFPPIPMAGFPAHVVDNYLIKLLKSGESVAICEQIDTNDEEDHSGILNRKVVKIITPGTICEDLMLPSKKDNIIGSIYEKSDNSFGYATLDLTSGNFWGYELKDKLNLKLKLQLTNPVELLYPQKFKNTDILKNYSSIKERPKWEFNSQFAKQELTSQFNIFDLDSFGWKKSKLAIKAAGCLLHYVKFNYNIKKIPHIRYFKIQYPQDTIMIDSITVKNLQILEDILPNKDTKSLFNLLDNNRTIMGSRLLRRWLLNPIRDISVLEARQNSISFLKDYYYPIQILLSNVGDLERILARLSLNNIKPRDLVILRKSLKILPEIKTLLLKSNIPHILLINNKIKDFNILYNLLVKAIADEPPYKLKEGGVIAKGYNDYLDNLRNLSLNKDDYIKNWEKRERQATGINSLKIMFNHTHGYFIQIKKSLSSTIKLPDKYHKIQTLTKVVRYITLELKEYEHKTNMFENQAISLEQLLFNNIVENILKQLNKLLIMSESLSELDILTNLAERAVTLNYVCPKFTDKKIFKYYGGRHPLVEQINKNFIKNDLSLNYKTNTLLITGPNMGGKSTYMKQTALIAILSYIGSCVPADRAIIGPIDSIFTRMGVNDDLSSGKSTFMVEMIETANILNNATKNSLIIIDEIGLDTNNVEGISIAWGCIKHLVNINSFNLIATHYIELTNMSYNTSKVKNIHFYIYKKNKQLIFLHKLIRGPVRNSFGINVAEMAGLPKYVIEEAYLKLKTLTQKNDIQN